MIERVCRTCKEAKPIKSYPTCLGYIHAHCKPCFNDRQRKLYHRRVSIRQKHMAEIRRLTDLLKIHGIDPKAGVRK